MHLATLHLAPILAETSRTPFYIAGGILVAWAFIVSVGIGMRRPDFPGSLGGERALIAISVVLVIATASTAVITSSPPAKAAGSSSASTTKTPAGAETPPAGAQPAPAAPAGGATAPGTSPKATTGTPAPPSSPAAPKAPIAPTTQLALAANPSGTLSYNTKQLSAKAGTVQITMANMSPLEHNVTIASGSTVLAATPTFVGGSRSVTVKLKAGTYTFYCSVPGHRQAGMEGTLTVSS
jgi:plastocyanin